MRGSMGSVALSLAVTSVAVLAVPLWAEDADFRTPVMLGVVIRPIFPRQDSDGRVRQARSLPRDIAGMQVLNVMPESGARAGGLRERDVIVALWRQGMERPLRPTGGAEFRNALRDGRDGEEVQLVICRQVGRPYTTVPRHNRLGITAAPVNPGEIGFGAAAQGPALRVERVEEDTYGALADIRDGDLLIRAAAGPMQELQPATGISELERAATHSQAFLVLGRTVRLQALPATDLSAVMAGARLFLEEGQPGKARDQALRAKAAFADNEMLRMADGLIAETHVAEGEPEKAIDILTTAVEEYRDRQGRGMVLRQLAETYAGMERWREAFEAMKRAARYSAVRTHRSDSRSDIGWIKFKRMPEMSEREQLEERVSLWERRLEGDFADEGKGWVLLSLAQLKFRLGETEAAAELLRRVVTEHPSYWPAADKMRQRWLQQDE
ncbi:MAG: tetratricopeptide repeat protein [Armatimonadota bacterium]